ncbi:MAG: winged helix-turn-helix transcriptional regulator [Candidatus Lokiarchaeota archaeon]|nr:winged helix-turn-helix transcriptional regulator [Candidatus Lokiarchaeota archaeon]
MKMKRNVLILGIIAIIISSIVPHLVSIGSGIINSKLANFGAEIEILRSNTDNQICMDNGMVFNSSFNPIEFDSNNLKGIGVLITVVMGINIANYPFLTEEQKENLEQDTRKSIFNLISENEGIHLREICRSLDRKMGVIQYHIQVLEGCNLIDSIKDGRYRRFFTNNKELRKRSNKMIVSFTRRETTSKLLKSIFNHNGTGIFHKELAEEANISSQAITWHIKKLIKEEIIKSEKVGRQKKYFILDEHLDFLKSLLDSSN